ncbi:MAG: RNA-binding protein [archaeon]|nr:RNA-binding protein [archaeon]
MIRNIPIKYTDKMVLEELKSFFGKFDCIYLPYDVEKQGNKGYAFINFIHPFHILLFYDKFQGHTWLHYDSKKICELNMANYQGIEEINLHSKNYKGKKPTFFYLGEDLFKNLEVPIRFLDTIRNAYPGITYEETSNPNIISIKSL